MRLKLKTIIKNAASQLQESGSLSPHLDAEVLMAFLLQKDRSYLFMYPEKEILPSIYEEYVSFIEARKKGKPIPYIVNNQEFMNLDFYVDENVLIPRPDTEVLIESVIKTVKSQLILQPRILDLGCGSGAISVSLAYYIPMAQVCGVDISDKAISVSEKNALQHGVSERLSFLSGDLFEPVKEKYDIIVSNPPYICSKEIDNLQVEVCRYEPRKALDGGLDGLSFYRKIILEAPKYIRNSGYLFLEIGYNQAEAVCALLSKSEVYSEIEVINDLAGKDRVVKASLGRGQVVNEINPLSLRA